MSYLSLNINNNWLKSWPSFFYIQHGCRKTFKRLDYLLGMSVSFGKGLVINDSFDSGVLEKCFIQVLQNSSTQGLWLQTCGS